MIKIGWFVRIFKSENGTNQQVEIFWGGKNNIISPARPFKLASGVNIIESLREVPFRLGEERSDKAISEWDDRDCFVVRLRWRSRVLQKTRDRPHSLWKQERLIFHFR